MESPAFRLGARTRTRSGLAAGLAAMTLVAAACGGADDDATSADGGSSSSSEPTETSGGAAEATGAASDEQAAGPVLNASVLDGEATTVTGETFDLGSLAGKDLVVWFWAPW